MNSAGRLICGLSKFDQTTLVRCYMIDYVLALDLEGVHDVKLHHPSSSVATSNQ